MSRKKSQISELDLSKIGGRIEYIRLINNENQAQFAEKTGLSKGNISGLENHKYEPSYSALVKILEIYKVDSAWLLTGIGDMVNNQKYLKPESTVDVIEFEHKNLIEKFKNKVQAKRLNEKLIKLESISASQLDRIEREVDKLIEISEEIVSDVKKTTEATTWTGQNRRRNQAS